MSTEFFKTTLISKYIKYLLSQSPLPLYKIIQDNDTMVQGCCYTYKDKILLCTKSGRFTGVSGSLGNIDHLTVTDRLEAIDPFHDVFRNPTVAEPDNSADNRLMNSAEYGPYAPDADNVTEGWMSIQSSDYFIDEQGNKQYTGDLAPTSVIPLSVTDDVVGVRLYTAAEFKVIDSYLPGEHKVGCTQEYSSNVDYYDGDTHKWLGEYLRYIKSIDELDLMPLYNCFTYKIADNFHLRPEFESGLMELGSSKYKVYLVPIKLNRKYTIAVDSDFPVYVKSVFYNDALVKDATGQYYISDYLNEPVTVYNSTQFNHPFLYEVSNAYDILYSDSEAVRRQKAAISLLLQKFERYLYLAIQVPFNNTSTVTVLEGDYSSVIGESVADVEGIMNSATTTDELSEMMISKLSLLTDNDGSQHPFSDKLIQYLLRNTIDCREVVDTNVERVEKDIGYQPLSYGQWDDELRYILFRGYMTIDKKEHLNFKDILGYVDSDIEYAIQKGYLKYGS